MKKVFLILCLFLVAGCIGRTENTQQYDTIQVVENIVVDDLSVPIFPRKAALTTDTARRFALDLPKRCSVDWNNQSVLSVLPAQPIEIIRLNTGDALPDFAVSDFVFTKKPVADVLEKLLDGTKIKVVSDENIPDLVSGEIKSGTLSDAVELISKLGHAYYTYDDDAMELRISSRGKWLMKMPTDQYMIMALLDAMRGAGLRNLTTNWADKTLVFSGNYQTERTARNIISDIDSKKYLVAWDLDIYRVYPRTDNPIVWMNMLPAFGADNIKMSIPGVVGRLLVTSPDINTKTLQEFLSTQANVVLISQGTFVLPNNWQSRFDIGQCSREDRLETDLIIGATGKYGKYADTMKVDAKIALRTSDGELVNFDVPSTLGDNYVIIGIPTHSFVTTPETLVSPFAELVVFMSPRVISITESDDTENTQLSGDALREYLGD
ncbi:MAG: hypothetical protein LBL75_00925 [Rickettsiales bacterium]|jgi:hypothetical protein|nr:hypothetical protein [Rickettsiales bacterium]